MIHEQDGLRARRLDGRPGKGGTVSPVPSMLRLFRENVRSYQPEGLALETGDPQVALDNINRLRQMGLAISQIHVRPTGALFLFTGGEQYYTPALRAGGDGLETEILAELAAECRWGDLEELLDFYHSLPPDFEGPLPDLLPLDSDDLESGAPRLLRYPVGNGQTGTDAPRTRT